MKLAGDWIDPAQLQREVEQVLVIDRRDKLLEALKRDAPSGDVLSGLTQIYINVMAAKAVEDAKTINIPEEIDGGYATRKDY